MQIKLKELTIKNFKGIRDLQINFNEKITNIYGDNGAGKTTIFDAYLWLLFDKDSNNCKDFNIKTLNEEGTVIPNLDHTVKAVLSVDGEEISLIKTYKEVYTKKRGSTTETFSGHTTDYYINEVPVKKSEYQQYISNLIDEEKFKLISNIRYFNVDLDKKKKREILMSISNINDEDVVRLNEDFKELDLKKYKIEEIQKIYKSKCKEINDELKALPIRIDELNNAIKDIDTDTLEFRRNGIVPAIEKLEKELSSEALPVEEIKKITEKINEIELKILDEKKKTDFFNSEIEDRYKRAYNKYNAEKTSYEADIKLMTERKTDTENEILNLENVVSDLREKYEEVAKTENTGSNICPVCNQEYPEEMLQDIQNKFNKQKSERLENIIKNAEDKKTKIEEYKEKLQQLDLNITDMQNRLNSLQEPAREEKQEYPEVITELSRDLEELKAEKEKLYITKDNTDTKNKIAKLKEELQEVDSLLAYKKVNEENLEKIKEYEKQEEKLSEEYSKAERMLYLTEEFNKCKAELISNDISKHFKLVDFKLFDTQINGGIIEVCEATVNGVPYSDVNNATKINAGLDIINTLSDKFKTYVPVFIDNAESVNELIDTKSQLVRLVVSKDKELKVE